MTHQQKIEMVAQAERFSACLQVSIIKDSRLEDVRLLRIQKLKVDWKGFVMEPKGVRILADFAANDLNFYMYFLQSFISC